MNKVMDGNRIWLVQPFSVCVCLVYIVFQTREALLFVQIVPVSSARENKSSPLMEPFDRIDHQYVAEAW